MSNEKKITEEIVIISAMVNDILPTATFRFEDMHKVQSLVERTNRVLEITNKEIEEKK